MSFFISPVLALIVLVPLLACVVVLLDTLSEKAAAQAGKPKKPDDVRWSERAVVFGSGGALIAAVVTTLRLVTSGASFGYFNLLRCIRVGMTDVALTLSLDPLRAALATAVAAGATWAAVLLAKRSTPRVHAQILIVLTGAELALTADNSLGIVFGIALIGAAAIATPSAKNAGLSRLAGAAAAFVLLGSAFLSWGIAGAWADGDYTPELYPRFIAATKSPPISEDNRPHTKAEGQKLGAVSLAAMGGAFIYIDESRVPWEVDKKTVRAPFLEEPITSGMHTFRIHEGFGLDDNVLSHVNVEEGKNLIIVPVGASLSPREIRAELDVLPGPTDDIPVPTRDGFGTVKVLGFSVATLAQWLFVIGAALLAFVALAWGREKPSPDARALSLSLLAVACATAYRVDFLGRTPTALWLLILGAMAALGFFISRSAAQSEAPEGKIAALVSRIADAFLMFDERVVDAPFRILSLTRLAREPRILAIGFALFVFAAPRDAHAATDDAARGRVDLVADGKRGPLVLVPKGNELTGQFDIINTGRATLSVLRVSVRTDAHDTRAPATLSAKADAPLPTNLAPGGHLRTTVTLSRNTHVEELFAHVVVTTTDESAGEVAIGVVGHTQARNAAPLGKNALSVLIVVLFGAAVVVLLLQLMKIEWAGRAGAAGAVVGIAVLGLLVYRFDPALTRADGNDGLSFIEKSALFPSLGSEYFLAADGLALIVALAIVLCAAITLLLVDLAELPSFERPFLLMACAAAMGAVFARDLLVFIAFFGAACALAVLVVRAASPPKSAAFGKSRAVVFLAFIAIALTVFAIQGASDPTFLVDGTRTAHTFSIAELSRVILAQKTATFAGAPLVKSGFIALVLAFAALAGVPPFHSFTLDAFRESRPAGIFAIAIVRVLGLYGFIHLVLPVLPESSRWGAGGVAWLAVFGAGYASICAFAAKSIAKKLGYLVAAQSSFALLGFASVTPQGLTAVLFGAISIIIAHTAAAALAASGVDMSSDARSLGALCVRRRAALAFALFACAGMPAFPGFYASLESTLGATARHPLQVLVLVIAFAFIVATVASIVPALLAERGPPSTPLTQSQGWAFFVLLFAVLATGVFPATCLDIAASAIRDRTAAADPPGAAEVALK